MNEGTKELSDVGRSYNWLHTGFEQTDDHPVVNASRNDAEAFVSWLSQKEGKKYRLPTEAEWEYACRAGTTTRFNIGDDASGLTVAGNIVDGTFKDRYPDDGPKAVQGRDGYVYTAPVARFQQNAFGLYDMHGNVWEWCSDWYDEHYYGNSPVNDPPGGARGAAIGVRRGGSWDYGASDCRSATRGFDDPRSRTDSSGFRVVREEADR